MARQADHRHGQRREQQDAHVREPLELLALDPVRGSQSHDQAGDPDQRRKPVEDHAHRRDAGHDVTGRAGQRVRVLMGARRLRLQHAVAERAAHDPEREEACREPGPGAPARRGQVPVGVQQRDPDGDEPDPDVGDPVVEPHRDDRRIVRGRRVADQDRGEGAEQDDRLEDPADRVARLPARHERADDREADEAEHEQPLELLLALDGVVAGEQGERHPQPEQPPREPRRRHRGLLSHSDTCAGWTVSRTTPRRSVPSASRSISSRSRPPNASSVCAAS